MMRWNETVPHTLDDLIDPHTLDDLIDPHTCDDPLDPPSDRDLIDLNRLAIIYSLYRSLGPTK